MAKPNKSIRKLYKESLAEVEGVETEMKSLFGSLNPAELVDKAKKEVCSASYTWLRGFIFDALGLESKSNPEYLILTGCLQPFRSTLSLLNYFRLLDRLGVAHAFLKETEYCSGHPVLYTARAENWDEAVAGTRELIEMNLAQARELGVKGVVYYCTWAFAQAQKLLTDSDMELLFYLDILMDKLEARTLRLKPGVVGYYEGCWQSGKRQFELSPERKLAWTRYRSLVDRIEGISVVELRHNVCCLGKDALSIIEEAERHRVNCIVTPCTESCQIALRRLTRIPVKLPSDILLEALV